MLARAGWLAGGLLAVAVGAVGVVIPGLPTTVFFIVAAWCFSRCSPRLERWVLDLPRIGPMVADYRAGLGMPRRAKVVAVVTMAVFVTLSAWLLSSPIASTVVVALGVVGAWFVLLRVPTREATAVPVAAPRDDRDGAEMGD